MVNSFDNKNIIMTLNSLRKKKNNDITSVIKDIVTIFVIIIDFLVLLNYNLEYILTNIIIIFSLFFYKAYYLL